MGSTHISTQHNLTSPDSFLAPCQSTVFWASWLFYNLSTYFSSYISQRPFLILALINFDWPSVSPGRALCVVCYHSTSSLSKSFIFSPRSHELPPDKRTSPLPPSSLSQPLSSLWEQNKSPGNTVLLSDPVFGHQKQMLLFLFCVLDKGRNDTG